MLIIAIGYGNYGGEPFSFGVAGKPISTEKKDILDFICSRSKENKLVASHIEEILVVENDVIVKIIGRDELQETPNACGAW